MDPDLEPEVRSRAIVVALAVCGGYFAMLVFALAAWPWAVFAAGVVAAVAEPAAERSAFIRPVLRRAQMPPAARSLLRDITVFVVIGTVGHDVTRRCAALAAVVVVRFVLLLAHVVVRRRDTAPVITMNLDLPSMPRRGRLATLALADEFPLLLHHISGVAAVGTALGVAVRSTPLVVALCAVSAIGMLVFGVALAQVLLASRGQSRSAQLRAVQQAVNRLSPRVMLYFSGSPDATYQVNMWLRTAERLDEPVVVVIREPVHMQTLAPTRLPVLFVAGATDFMALTWPHLRVVFYVANVGKNIHMLRERGLRHVFIGHGDSDKTGSFSPFSKVYSEIWVAGPAGRERYTRARVGIRDDEIVEVGRPQLVGIEPAGPVADGKLVVLYAPTWEGWPGDPPHSSLATAGVRLVSDLLRAEGVRVIYKPHPLTGTVSSAAAAAHKQILALVRDAGDPHEVVTSGRSLYECFNSADVLVGDISSVVSDFLASEKPYVMANLHKLPDDELRARFPSSSGAYLIGADGSGLPAVLATIRGGDPLAEARHAARLHLLGSTPPGDISSFAAAIDAAAHAAEQLRPSSAATEAV